MGRASRRRQLNRLGQSAKVVSSTLNPALPDAKLQRYEMALRQHYLQMQRHDWRMWENMLREMKAIQERIRNEWSVTPYQHGQLALFEALSVACPVSIEDDPNLEAIDLEQVKAAGRLLNESGGFRDMHDAVVIWTPKSVHSLVDAAFDGIGEWLS